MPEFSFVVILVGNNNGSYAGMPDSVFVIA